MSMPFIHIECEHGDYSGRSSVLWGRFEYETPTGLISIDRVLGWCHGCASVAPVEVLPSAALVSELERKIAKALAAEQQHYDEARANMPPWKRALGFRPVLSDESIRLSNARLSWQDDLRDARVALDALTDRQSPPRCLVCGDMRVSHFSTLAKITDLNPEIRRKQDAGLKHPGCGGQLTYRQSSVWVSPNLSHRNYDLEGRFLR